MTSPAEPFDRPLDGLLLVDKPSGLTSHDVVERVRRLAGTRRVGHAGTLDMMAEGLLLVLIGPATRISQFLIGLPKEYAGRMTLGAVSSTYDAEGKIMAQPHGAPLPSEADPIREAMRAQIGWRVQLPPPFSAVKVRGRKLYEYARAGEEAPPKPRRVLIERFELVDYHPPLVSFRARVGSGTYIRSMVHDLGAQLGCGAFLSALRRERVGGFSREAAAPLDQLSREPSLVRDRLLTVADALAHLPKITVGPELEPAILHGRAFTRRQILACETLPGPGETFLVLNAEGRALAIVRSSGAPEPTAPGEATEAISASHTKTAIEGEVVFRPARVLG